MRHRYETKSEPTERVFEDGPLAPEVTRSRLPAPEPCCDGCKGWEVFESDQYGLHLAVCDECWTGVSDDRRVYDDDIAELPEAKAALVARIEADGPGEVTGWEAVCYASAKGCKLNKNGTEGDERARTGLTTKQALKYLKQLEADEWPAIWCEVGGSR